MAGEISGVPAVDFYGMLSGIGDTIQKNRKQAHEQALREAFKDGLPTGPDGSTDFKSIGNTIAQHGGDLSSLLTVAKLSEEQRKSRDEQSASADFRSGLGNLFGGASQTATQPAMQPTQQQAPSPLLNVGAPQNMPRPPVAPSPKVWGDKEAEDAGLYDKPTPAAGNFYDGLSGQKQPALQSQLVQPPTQTQSQGLNQAPAQTQAAASRPAQNGFQGIGVQHVPMLIQSMSNPRLPAGDRELAGKLLTRALDDSKEPDKIRTLTALKEQSNYPGTILQLEMEMRKASKTDVNTTIDQRGETEEAKAAGKAAGERRAAMFGAANSATNNLSTLTRVGTLLDQVQQGKIEPSRMTIGAWAKSFGVSDDFAKGLGLDPSKIGTSQAVQAMTNELVLGKIGAGGLPANNFSDADRQFLTDTLPKIGNDPRANKILLESARRVHQDSIQRAVDYQTWKDDPTNKSKSFEDFELNRARRVAQMDRFGDLRKQAETLTQNDAPSGQVNGPSGPINWRVK